MLFYGAQSHSLDDKGRLSIPSAYRDTLARLEANELVCTFSGRDCLLLYPLTQWDKILDRINNVGRSESRKALRTVLLSNATICPLDKQGRLLVPVSHRRMIELDSEVEIVGEATHIQLWRPDRWKSRIELMKQVLSDDQDAVDDILLN